ncbi:MAG: phage tail length tape measure family protein [Paracoccaceae bacterium]
MALNSVIGSLRVNLGLNSAAFGKGLTKSEKELKAFQRSVGRIGQNLQGLGAKLSIGLTVPFAGLAAKSADAAAKQEKAVAAVEAALASMGNQAGFTSQQLQKMASSLQANSLFGDEDILNKVTANLLTFGNIANEEFSRASQLALDLSARLDQDLKSSAIQLGKALNDPVKGLSSLSEVGVAFTEQQKEQIKAMAETGRVAEAQRIILAELEQQYRGQAAALAETDSGRLTQSLNRISDATEKIGAVVLPVLANIAERAAGLADAFSNLSPTVQRFGIVAAGVFAAGGPLLIGIGLAVQAFAALAPVVLALSAPLAVVAGTVGLAVAGFKLFKAASEDAEQPIYDAAAATAAINGELDAFYRTTAPEAGKAAINLANDFVKLAAEALNAAEAEVARRKAFLAAVENDTIRGRGGRGQELGAQRELREGLAQLEQAERDLAEARRNQKRAATAVTGATYDYAEAASEAGKETKVVIEGLEDLGRVSGGGGGRNPFDGITAGADAATGAVEGLSESIGGLDIGSLQGGFKGLFSDLGTAGANAFAAALQKAFGKGGGGIGGLFTDIGFNISSGLSQIRSVFSGGGLGALGAAVSSFLPVIGAIGAIGGALKGLIGSTKVIGQGFKIGVSDGALTGGQFTTKQTKRLFGLISRTRTSTKPFSDEVGAALNEQLTGVQEGVRAVFEGLDVQVSEAVLNGVSLASTRFDTRGLEQDEIEAKFAEVFASYGDALSEAIGGINFEAAGVLLSVSQILKPAGQAFFGSLEFMADAATDLAERLGGINNLQSSVGSFADLFFTDAEKLAAINTAVSDVFSDLSLAIPATVEGFKDLVLSQNLMTEAGRETYAALLQIAPQFKAIADAANAFSVFDLSEKRFETAFQDRVAQIAEDRNFNAAQIAALGGSVLDTSPNTTTGLLRSIDQRLEDILMYGTPERA